MSVSVSVDDDVRAPHDLPVELILQIPLSLTESDPRVEAALQVQCAS